MKKMQKFEIGLIAAVLLALLIGCASIANLTLEDLGRMAEKGLDVYAQIKEATAKWDAYQDSLKPEEPAAPEEPAPDPVNVDSEEDAVAFSSLNWTYGHFNGAGAVISTPRIANLSVKDNKLSYQWAVGMGGWNLAHDDAGALACAFVQRADGTWVGGKFEWVSTSRSSRSMGNALEGYNGWNFAGVPNPCQLVFVVVENGGKRRSNVAGPVLWSR